MDQKTKETLFRSIIFFYDKEGKPRASGFLLNYPIEGLEGKCKVYLITVKHNVIKSHLEQGYITFSLSDDLIVKEDDPRHKKGIPTATSKIEDWFFDAKTDLAVFDYTKFARYRGIPSCFEKNMLVGRDEKYRSEMTEILHWGEQYYITEHIDTFSVGLFSSYYGKTKERPIFRYGKIAMVPEDKISIKLPTIDNSVEEKEVEAFLIEQRSIGGMSGSIVLADYLLKPVVKIVGIIHGHYDDLNDKSQNDYENPTGEQQCQDIKKDCDNIYSKCQKIEQQVQKKHERMKSINSGISIVIPSYKILELLEREDVRNAREDAKKKHLDSLRNLL